MKPSIGKLIALWNSQTSWALDDVRESLEQSVVEKLTGNCGLSSLAKQDAQLVRLIFIFIVILFISFLKRKKKKKKKNK